MQKRIMIAVMMGLASITSIAVGEESLLNIVMYKTQVKQWVQAETAKVTISIDATVKSNKISRLQETLMAKLSQLSPKIKWHIVYFEQSQDPSGLEHLHWQVIARLPFDQLGDLRKKVANLSATGVKFQLQSISYTPSLVQFARAQAALRKKIYLMAQNEVKQLNQVYAKQHYFVHAISFQNMAVPQPKIVAFVKRQDNGLQDDVSLGREMTVYATVTLASQLDSKYAK